MRQLRAAAVDFVLRYEDGPSVGVSVCTVSDRWKKLGGVNWTEMDDGRRGKENVEGGMIEYRDGGRNRSKDGIRTWK